MDVHKKISPLKILKNSQRNQYEAVRPVWNFDKKNYSIVDVFVRIFENVQTNDFS